MFPFQELSEAYEAERKARGSQRRLILSAAVTAEIEAIERGYEVAAMSK